MEDRAGVRRFVLRVPLSPLGALGGARARYPMLTK
jgi:hypothetical protein